MGNAHPAFANDFSPRRLTFQETIHHHFYFTNQTFSPGGERLYFVRYDGDVPNIYATDAVDAGRPEPITDTKLLNPFSPTVDPEGTYIYFTGGQSVWRVPCDGGEPEEFYRLSTGYPSNMAMSPDGRWVATSVRGAKGCELIAINTQTCEPHVVLRKEMAIGHVQFSRVAPLRILYSGPPDQRIWLVDFDGANDQLLYEQRPDDWIVHESWLNEREVLFTHWPDALLAIDIQTKALRVLAATNAWHACADVDGRTVVYDTVHPDRGLQLLDPQTGDGTLLCQSNSSSLGSQWQYRTPAPEAALDSSIFRDVTDTESLPAVDPRESTYGPQWTHPHPAFSPEGNRIVYTSDETGHPQIYVVDLPTTVMVDPRTAPPRRRGPA